MKKISIFLVFIVSVISCSHNSAVTLRNDNDTLAVKEDSIESFQTFIKVFHDDSILAHARIEKETVGSNTDDYEYDTLGNPHNTERIWTKEQMMTELRMINELLTDKKYKVKYEANKDEMVETIFLPESGFILHLYFRMKEKKWFLTEYYYNNL